MPTQFGSASDVKQFDQDGYASGTLAGFSIGKDGTVTGKYSNEQVKTLGQIVLSSFVNPAGLQSKGDNVWTETAASGQALTGNPGSGALGCFHNFLGRTIDHAMIKRFKPNANFLIFDAHS